MQLPPAAAGQIRCAQARRQFPTRPDLGGGQVHNRCDVAMRNRDEEFGIIHDFIDLFDREQMSNFARAWVNDCL